MNNFKTISALALGALTAASALAATDGPYTATYPGSGTVTLDFPFGATVSLPQFNIPGATLQSISLTATYSGVSNIQFENTGQGTGTVDFSSRSVLFILQKPGGTGLQSDPNKIIQLTAPLLDRSFTYTAFDTVNDKGGTSGVTFTPEEYTQSTSSPAVLTGGSDLAAFTGSGTVTLPILNKVGYQVFGGGTSDITTPTTGSAQVSVTYTYTTNVPEPKVYGAIGAVACLGLLGYRRFRNNQAAQA